LLVALIAVVLVAIVPLLCFVGCSFHPGSSSVTDYGKYHDTVLQTTGLYAYWALIETTGTTAVDSKGNGYDGTYTQGQNVPYDPVNQSAAATGEVDINNAAIVPGDKLDTPPHMANNCPYFNGGFVTVPWKDGLNTTPPFTLEAWLRPHWTASDAQNFPATRAAVTSANSSSNGGFSLLATADNFWAAVVGIGSGFVLARPAAGSNQTILPDTTYYLVMTYDGTTLTLWVNPANTAAGPYAQATASGFVPVTSPTPLYIGTGRPDLPTPLFPFNGWIQDVALYNVVLDNPTIETHFMNGNAIQMT
jgi:hypothetical protein